MSARTKRIIIISGIALIFISGFFIFFFNNNVVESVKRKSAALFVYEYIPNQDKDIEACIVIHKQDSIYQDFRKKFRLHYQTIGIANFEDSSKMILISEPPPYFEIDSIQSIFAKFTHRITTKKHKMGYDGNVTDIIISLANATDENVEKLIKRLSERLFLSDYKPYHIKLPAETGKVYFSKSNLDYRISLQEFNDWFLEYDELFIAGNDTSNSFTIENIFAEKKRGVYFSKLPGFVAWAIAKKSDLSHQIKDIRQFTLDADLILGGLSDSSTLVIIGRERECPVYELPPLNIESVLLLASITDKELSQSLDINDFLAGKMVDGKDWCPTYLSRELENTEFGHLMTITDILLKDWSEKGTIKEAYYRYPEPGYYPFNLPLFKKLGLNELVYNWNTANAMYAIDLDNRITIYTLNRTGSLPVSYFNSQERSQSVGHQYENQAWHYFATLGNSDLVRVVQYTALYQLFMDNNIHYTGNIHSAFPKNKPYLLVNPVKNLLNIFKKMSQDEIRQFADSISSGNFQRYHKDKVLEQLKSNETKYSMTYNEEQKDRIFSDVQQNNSKYIQQEITAFKNKLNTLPDEQFDRLVKYLAYPRGVKINDQSSYNIYLLAHQANKMMRSIGKNNLYLIGLDLRDVKNYFAANLSGSSARYLKTPSLIITFNDFNTTGGHNISSGISRVNSMTNYKKSSSHPVQAYEKEKKTGDEPEVTKVKTPVTSTPSSEKKSSPSTAKPVTTKAPAAGSAQKLQSGNSSRSRSSVISSGARSNRGF